MMFLEKLEKPRGRLGFLHDLIALF